MLRELLTPRAIDEKRRLPPAPLFLWNMQFVIQENTTLVCARNYVEKQHEIINKEFVSFPAIFYKLYFIRIVF